METPKQKLERGQDTMSKVIEIPQKEKTADFKAKVREKLQSTKNWIEWHRNDIITFTPVVIAGATTVIKVVGRRINLHKQEAIKNLYCYDRSLGHYWQLRRPLTNKEWLAIDARRRNGERMADILESMKVLK